MKTDNLTVYALMHELVLLIETARIEKIHQPTQYELIFHVRTKQGNKKLLVSIHPETFRMHITDRTYINPAQPKNFCVVLRKYIEGGIITKVEQVGHDRIVRLNIQSYNAVGDLTRYTLYVELMGKYSNVVLVDQSDMIIDVFKKVDEMKSEERPMLPKQKYYVPEVKQVQTGFDFYLQPFLKSWLEQHAYSPEVLLLHAKKPEGFYYKLKSGKALYTFLDISDGLDVKETLRFPTLSEAIDLYYYDATISQQLKEKTTHLLHVVDQTYKRKRKKREKLAKEYTSATDYEQYQLIGNLLLAQQYTLPAHMKEVVLDNYYDDAAEKITVQLNEQQTIVENAQRYFKKYTKSKTAIDKLQEQLDETDREIAYFETILQSLQYADLQQAEEIAEELREQGYLKVKSKAKKVKKIPQYARYVYNDIEYLVGKNNLQNDYVTFKMRRKDYTWLHVKDAPGSHVLIMHKTPITEEALFVGALLAAYFSKVRESENVPVDYTLVQNVSKPAGAKPGYVIYKEQKTIYVSPSRTNLQTYFSDFI